MRHCLVAAGFLKKGSSSLWISVALGENFDADLLADPDALLSRADCEIIKDQKKTKVGRLWLGTGGMARRIYVKRYNVFSWYNRLGSLFFPSRARRSWVGGEILLASGFGTPPPVATVECRSRGLLTKSFYLSEEIPLAKSVIDFWHEDLARMHGLQGFRRRRRFLRALAALFRSLHRANIYHNDLKGSNIFVLSPNGAKERFFLLDLEDIRKYRRLNGRRRIKNLVQLNRTLGKFLRATERLYFLDAYLARPPSGKGERRKWGGRVLEQSERLERRSGRKILLEPSPNKS